MTLAEVLGRGVSIEWYEGVAIVRAVLARLFDSSLRPDLFPELHEIEILPDGEVTFGNRSFVRDRVAKAHQLLQHLLAEGKPPIQLRLFLSRTSLGTLREYDESLGYFERPDRAEVLAQLHARATHTVPAPIDAAQVLNRIEPPRAEKAAALRPEIQSSRRAGSPRPRQRRLKMLATAAVVVAVAAPASYYLTSSPADRAERPQAESNAPEAIQPLEVERPSVPAATTDSAVVWGPGVVSAPPLGPASTAAPAASARTPLQMNRVEAQTPNVAPQTLSVQAAKAPVAAPQVVPTPSTKAPGAAPPAGELLGALTVIPVKSPAPPAPAPQATPGSSLVIEAFANNEPPIYSAGSPGVIPPVSLMPPLPPALPANLDPQDIGRIELVIGSDGVVESVKLLAVPGNVPHSMLLSAVKAWKFEPAMKDGMPVRYRQSVWLGPSNLGAPFSWQLAR
jgi:hypothetical protein